MGDSFPLATGLAAHAARSTEAAKRSIIAAPEPPLVIIAAVAAAEPLLVLLPATSTAATVPGVAKVLAFIVPVGSAAAAPSLVSRTPPAAVAEILL